MTTENQNHDSTTPGAANPGNAADPADKDSILDNLREAGQAWLSAGSRLGGVVADFAGRLRDNENESPATGAHALHDPVLEKENPAGRFRAAAKAASEKLGSARSADELKAATGGFASHAEDIFRDLATNVRRAVNETRDSESVEHARSAFSEAVGQVRESFDEAVSGVQDRRKATGGTDAEDGGSTIDELRSRLDDLISRASSLASRGDRPAAADEDAADSVDPDIIEGELISEDDGGDTTPENSQAKEKDK